MDLAADGPRSVGYPSYGQDDNTTHGLSYISLAYEHYGGEPGGKVIMTTITNAGTGQRSNVVSGSSARETAMETGFGGEVPPILGRGELNTEKYRETVPSISCSGILEKI